MDRKSSSLRKLVIGIILLLISLLSTGCAKTHYKHYEGPPLPDSELALLKASKQIRSIDGHSYRYGTGGKDFAKAITTGLFSDDLGRTYWQIKPGKHEIEIRVRGTGEKNTICFLIEVEKSHTYKIDEKNFVKDREYFSYVYSLFPTEKQFIEYSNKTGDLIFFLIDLCCPSRDPVPLMCGKVNRIE